MNGWRRYTDYFTDSQHWWFRSGSYCCVRPIRRAAMNRERSREFGFQFFKVRCVLMHPPVNSSIVRTPFLHKNSEVNVTIGSMISPHATAEKINVLKAHRRL